MGKIDLAAPGMPRHRSRINRFRRNNTAAALGGADRSGEPKAAARQDSGNKSIRAFLLPLLLLLIGLGIILYPLVATQIGNWERARIAQNYSQEIVSVDNSDLEEVIQAARAYNQRNAGAPILDPWLARVAKDNLAYQEYLQKLAILPEMGRLRIPVIKVDLPIYHGTDNKTLERGVGHLYGTDLPIGDTPSHSVLTAHSGLSSATLFDNLTDLQPGDAFYLEVAGKQMKYQVVQTKVVLPEEVSSLHQQVGKDLVTLITCTPYGINSHRLMVTGERVEMDSAETPFASTDTWNWQWWMSLIVAIVLAVLLFFARWLYKMRKEFRESLSGKTAPKIATAGGENDKNREQIKHISPENFSIDLETE